MLILHILFAVSAIISNVLLALKPTFFKIKTSYISSSMVIVSGLLLLLSPTVSVKRVCITGGVFVLFTAIVTVSARRKLAMVNATTK